VIAPLDTEVIGSGPPVLLLHGAGGSPRDNFPFMDELAREFTVVGPSFPGVNGTPLMSEPLTAAGVAERVRVTLDEIGVETAAVAAYSMGTTIAAHLAATCPDRITAFALSAGLTRPRPSLRSLLDVWDALLDGRPDVLGRFILGSTYRPETSDERGSAWVAAAAAAIGSSFPRGTRAHLDLLRNVDSSQALSSTEQPLLIVVPEHDGLVHPGHSDDLFAARPDAQRVDLVSGHALGDEAAYPWFEALVNFLRSTA